MCGILEIHGEELGPILSRAQKRWRLAFNAVSTIRALLSEGRGIIAVEVLRVPSFTVLDVEPDYPAGINQPVLKRLVEEKDLGKLLQLGGVQAVLSALGSHAENGIQGDVGDIARRQINFGYNSSNQKPPPEKMFHLGTGVFLEAFKDPIILILLVCAVLSLVYGINKQGWEGGSNGGSILAALAVVITVSLFNNFWLTKQFNDLSQATENTLVDVRRNGQLKKIPIFDVVVGDVVSLTQGDQVPAHGLLLEAVSVLIDESSMTVCREPVEVNLKHNPFLISGTKVVDGSALMLATSVGCKTEEEHVMIQRISSPLQAKLKQLTFFIGMVGVAVAFLALSVLLARYFTGNMHDEHGKRHFTAGKTQFRLVFDAIIGIIATPVAIAAAAVPEGLLLAATVTLAYSTKRMLERQALVRDLSCFEAMGSVSVICTDESGILMLKSIKVMKFWLGQKYIEEGASSSIAPDILELIHQGVGWPAVHHRTGSLSELYQRAFYEWGIKEMGMNIEKLQEGHRIIPAEESFSSDNKESSTVFVRKEARNTVHVHQKGAPEVILPMCSSYHDDTGDIKVIDDDVRELLQQAIQDMENSGFQCIAFAHKQMSQEEENHEGNDAKLSQAVLEENSFALLALVGLNNPYIAAREAVSDCLSIGVNVKMITTEDVSTAEAIAAACGIIEAGQGIATGEVVEGMEFQSYEHDERMKKVDIIRVIAKASDDDKHLMVQCLQEKGHVVAVTRDDSKDRAALRAASVGLCMGTQGADTAKESSSIVMLDGNLALIVEVLRWGKGMYINIRTFTQFQLTISITSLLIDFITTISAGEPPTIDIVAAISTGKVPYATLQLLWLKLIVGTLAALALTIEQPTKEVLHKQLVRGTTTPFITNIMWSNMLAQASYQIAVLLTIYFGGESIFSLTAKVRDTLIFNTFVFFHVFTMFNARKFEKNVLEGIKRKRIFWGIVGMIILLQVVMVEFMKEFAGTERLSWGQWTACFGTAAVSCPIDWFVNYVLKHDTMLHCQASH
ncbi:calcium-transporting ATPase 12, plasma membrane-type-like [Diospyros lotus]|uniref:calcium-transporting ATPase 12, plasma membrane-type-like n=1 Tax=Diospyros lotus TaxID=55363 RepID=UPI00225AB63E|nr:calcium-transporting ATPase 12, plasma membrane-type-like [Diospyros lotus]